MSYIECVLWEYSAEASISVLVSQIQLTLSEYFEGFGESAKQSSSRRRRKLTVLPLSIPSPLFSA